MPHLLYATLAVLVITHPLNTVMVLLTDVRCAFPHPAGKGRGKKILLPFQLAVLAGISITYTVVGGESLHAFAEGVAGGGHVPGKWAFIVMFGGLQLFLSMVSLCRGCLSCVGFCGGGGHMGVALQVDCMVSR
jgi:hypothetical protein